MEPVHGRLGGQRPLHRPTSKGRDRLIDSGSPGDHVHGPRRVDCSSNNATPEIERAMEVIERHDAIVRTVSHPRPAGARSTTSAMARLRVLSTTSHPGCRLGDRHQRGLCRDRLQSARLSGADWDPAPASRWTAARTLYGAVVTLAARNPRGLAEPGQILVSAAVKELAIGKSFGFADRRPDHVEGIRPLGPPLIRLKPSAETSAGCR